MGGRLGACFKPSPFPTDPICIVPLASGGAVPGRQDA